MGVSKDYDVCSEPGGGEAARLAAINFCISMAELGAQAPSRPLKR